MLEALRLRSLAGEGQGDGMTSQRGNWSQGHRAVDLSRWEQGVHQALSQVHLDGRQWYSGASLYLLATFSGVP